MEILHCNAQAAFLMRQEGCPNNHAPNNNTPVQTGVLWGVGVRRAGLRASAPASDYYKQILDIRVTVVITVAIGGSPPPDDK